MSDLSGSSVTDEDELEGWDLSCHVVCCDVVDYVV